MQWNYPVLRTTQKCVYSRDEQTAAEIEDDFSLPTADAASRILKREIEAVVVLPKVLQ